MMASFHSWGRSQPAARLARAASPRDLFEGSPSFTIHSIITSHAFFHSLSTIITSLLLIVDTQLTPVAVHAMAMDSSKLSALLFLLMLFISSTPLAFACAYCRTPSPKTPKSPKGPITLPPIIGKPPRTPKSPKGPITLPPIIGKPPITLPPVVGNPPISLPPVNGKPPVILPPVIGKPPITLPPVVGTPPITVPPIIGTPPATGKPGCPPPPAAETCPVDALKLGACVDILGSTVHVGDPAVECCPLLGGLAGVEAALCLCTTIKAKLLNINVVLPIALQLLVTCGNAAPPG